MRSVPPREAITPRGTLHEEFVSSLLAYADFRLSDATALLEEHRVEAWRAGVLSPHLP
jgi:hypothetical protein